MMSSESPQLEPRADTERRELLPQQSRWLDKAVETASNLFGVSEERLRLRCRDETIDRFEELAGKSVSPPRTGRDPSGAFEKAFVTRERPQTDQEAIREREAAITKVLEEPLAILDPGDKEEVWHALGELTEEAGLDRPYNNDEKTLLQAVLAHGDANFGAMVKTIGGDKAVRLRDAVRDAKTMAFSLYRSSAWREFTERMLSGTRLTEAEQRAGNFIHKHPVTLTEEAFQSPSEFARSLTQELAEALLQGEPYTLTTAAGEKVPLQVPLTFAHDSKSGKVRFAGLDLGVQEISTEPPCYQVLGRGGVAVARISLSQAPAEVSGAFGIINDPDCAGRSAEADLSGVGIHVNVTVGADRTAVIETACDHRITDLSPITRLVGRFTFDLKRSGYLEKDGSDYLPRSPEGKINEESLVAAIPDPSDGKSAEELLRLPEYTSLALAIPVTGVVRLREMLLEAAKEGLLKDPDGNDIDPAVVTGLGTWLTLEAASQLQDLSRSGARGLGRVPGMDRSGLAEMGSLAMLGDIDYQLGEMHITHLLEATRMIESGTAWDAREGELKMSPDFYKLWPKLTSYHEPGSPEDVTSIVRTIHRAGKWVRSLAARFSDKVFPEAMGGIIGDGMVGVSRGWPRGSMDLPGVALSARTQTSALALGEFFRAEDGQFYSCGQMKMRQPVHTAKVAREMTRRMCRSNERILRQVAEMRSELGMLPLVS